MLERAFFGGLPSSSDSEEDVPGTVSFDLNLDRGGLEPEGFGPLEWDDWSTEDDDLGPLFAGTMLRLGPADGEDTIVTEGFVAGRPVCICWSPFCVVEVLRGDWLIVDDDLGVPLVRTLVRLIAGFNDINWEVRKADERSFCGGWFSPRPVLVGFDDDMITNISGCSFNEDSVGIMTLKPCLRFSDCIGLSFLQVFDEEDSSFEDGCNVPRIGGESAAGPGSEDNEDKGDSSIRSDASAPLSMESLFVMTMSARLSYHPNFINVGFMGLHRSKVDALYTDLTLASGTVPSSVARMNAFNLFP
jgi:hypothetical protein